MARGNNFSDLKRGFFMLISVSENLSSRLFDFVQACEIIDDFKKKGVEKMTKKNLSVYLDEQTIKKLDEVAKNYDIPRNRLVANILSEVVHDFEAVTAMSKYNVPVGVGRVFFVERYLD